MGRGPDRHSTVMMLLGQAHCSPQDEDTVPGWREEKTIAQVSPLHEGNRETRKTFLILSKKREIQPISPEKEGK